MKFQGFPKGARYSAIPSHILNGYVEMVGDLAELKTVLRIFWILGNKKGKLRYITPEELCADRILTKSLFADSVEQQKTMVFKALESAVSNKILIKSKFGQNKVPVYFLNTESNRVLTNSSSQNTNIAGYDSWEIEKNMADPYSLYEQNIGMITPLIADKIREAEETFPTEWISEAITESVNMNKRNWAYISRILTNWQIEGRSNGKSGEHSSQNRYR